MFFITAVWMWFNNIGLTVMVTIRLCPTHFEIVSKEEGAYEDKVLHLSDVLHALHHFTRSTTDISGISFTELWTNMWRYFYSNVGLSTVNLHVPAWYKTF